MGDDAIIQKPVSTLYPDWLVWIAEYSTFVFAGLLCLIFIFLWGLFAKFQSHLDILLTNSFKAEFYRTLVTVFMGLFLYLDWVDGIQSLIIIRPLVIAYSCYCLGHLLKHYLELFDTTITKELKYFNNYVKLKIKEKVLCIRNLFKKKN